MPPRRSRLLGLGPNPHPPVVRMTSNPNQSRVEKPAEWKAGKMASLVRLWWELKCLKRQGAVASWVGLERGVLQVGQQALPSGPSFWGGGPGPDVEGEGPGTLDP